MKLYYLPGACSLASHISLLEAGIPVEAIAVDRQKRTADGQDFLDINPKGYVPALVLDSGEVLGESAALLPYIGQLDQTHRLIPPAGSLGHFRVTEWCAYVNSEVHKSFTPLFRPGSTDDMKAAARAAVMQRLEFLEKQLGDKPYLTGGNFTVADAYLYVTLSWTFRVGIDFSALPALTAYYTRCASRPAVQAARRAEKLPA
ncbi:MAG: glutathione transferase GstA [Pseudomonadota bacterium]|jgi:glutathione S-transferase